MSRPSEDALRVVQTFNQAYFERALRLRASELPAVAPGRLFGHRRLWTSADGHLDITPYQLMVGIVRGMQGGYEVQVQQGPLIIASAVLIEHDLWRAADEPSVVELILQTLPLSMFRVYPLHVFADEPDTFFHNRGYGRLMLYFAALHCVCAGDTLSIQCDNVVTAHILAHLFPPASATTADVGINQDTYLADLQQAGVARFADFQRWFANRKSRNGGRAVIYSVHATARNRAACEDAIAKWSHDLVAAATDEQFMARFLHTPAREHFNRDATMQLCYPELTYQHVLAAAAP